MNDQNPSEPPNGDNPPPEPVNGGAPSEETLDTIADQVRNLIEGDSTSPGNPPDEQTPPLFRQPTSQIFGDQRSSLPMDPQSLEINELREQFSELGAEFDELDAKTQNKMAEIIRKIAEVGADKYELIGLSLESLSTDMQELERMSSIMLNVSRDDQIKRKKSMGPQDALTLSETFRNEDKEWAGKINVVLFSLASTLDTMVKQLKFLKEKAEQPEQP